MTFRRIKRPKDKEDVFLALTEGEDAIFDTYKDLMVFSACLGYVEGSRIKMDKGSLEPIDFSVFSGECDQAIFNMLALAETGEPKVFESRDEMFAIFEEYANSGLEILRRKVIDAPGKIMDNMIDYLHRQKEDISDDPISILKGIGNNI